jgi:site-specific recombinase XerC
MPVASITTAEVSNWIGSIMSKGSSASSATRYLNTLRSILNYAVADGRVSVNVAAGVEAPSGGQARREGQFLTVRQLGDLAAACHGPYAELVLVLGMGGLRWGELAGLQVGDLVHVPGRGLRLQRAALSSGAGGGLTGCSALLVAAPERVELEAVSPVVGCHQGSGAPWVPGS